MYEASEDTWLLAEALPETTGNAVDMGTGNAEIAKELGKTAKRVIAVDNDLHVIAQHKDTENITFIHSDLFRNIPEKFKGSIQVVAFNPPYLPRNEEFPEHSDLESAENGSAVTKRFIREAKPFLAPDGALFFVTSSQADTDAIHSVLSKENYEYEVVATDKFFFEELNVVKAWQKT